MLLALLLLLASTWLTPHVYWVWVTGSGIKGSARLTLRFISTAGTWIGEQDSPLARGDFGWMQLEGSVTPPAGARYMRLECQLHGRGTVWLDNVVLELQ